MGSFINLQGCIMIFAVVFVMLVGLGDCQCRYEAIFNFGDSNSDTGGFWEAFPPEPPGPHGMTYFKPVGAESHRVSDGRLIIDFLAEAFSLPWLTPYLVSFGWRYGSNFATLTSTVLPPNSSVQMSGISPFSLEVQLNQMKNFKSSIEKIHSGVAAGPDVPLEVFGKALYTFYIGQYDFTTNLASHGIHGAKQSLPAMVQQISRSIKEIYGIGGRAFLVQNMAPIGCYPAFLVQLPHKKSDLDEFGCMVSYNKAVMEYNNMLKKALSETRQQLHDATVIYADTYTPLLDLFRHPTSYGLKYGTRACCGAGGGAYNFDPKVYCGNSKVMNGKNITATACNDPYNYVSWDGIQTTEAANKVVANAILSGNYSDPPFRLYCT